MPGFLSGRVAALGLSLAVAACVCRAEDFRTSCGDQAGDCAADDDTSMLAVNIARHAQASQPGSSAAAEEEAVGRCCYGMHSCPSQLGVNDWVPGCRSAGDRCSRSKHACEEQHCCRTGPFHKRGPMFCPVTSSKSKCALGDSIRVVTDMGFDDWGAFSVLSAAGCPPQKALATDGMMPVAFAGNFSKLLRSWHLDTQVFIDTGIPEGTCYDGKPCIVNTTSVSWLGEDYRPKVYRYLPEVTGKPWSEVERWGDDVSSEVKDFWGCEGEEKYTLLVISPQTPVATQLLGPKGSTIMRKCIKEIVYMGGLFASAQLQGTDPGTMMDAPVGPAYNLNRNHVDVAEWTEINVVSDVPAAIALWDDRGPWKDHVTQRIFSLETASWARPGWSAIAAGGQSGMYDEKEQMARSTEEVRVRVQENAGCDSPETMLAKMACIHSTTELDVATLDFDALAASYLWLGDSDETVSIKLEQSKVTVSATSGVVKQEPDEDAAAVFIAQSFDALAWLDKLSALLAGK